jgi:hypothetical protein
MEVAHDDDGHVEVALHEGRRVWVDAARVSPLALEVGMHVVTRWNDTVTLYRGDVVGRYGDLVEVLYTDGSRALVALPSVLAVSDEGTAAQAATNPTEVEPTTPEAPHPSRLVVVGTSDVWAAGRAMRCDDGVVVLFPDGTTRAVPEADVRDVSMAVGARVAARYNDAQLSYLGTVRELRDGRALVIYEDDGSEEWVRPDQLTYLLGEPAAASPSRPSPASRTGGICRGLRHADVPTVFVRIARAERVAVVARCTGEDDAQVVLTDHGGGERTVPRESVRALAVATGDRVLVPWGESHFFALVTRLDEATMHVRYEDGSEEDKPIGVTMMRLVAPDAPEGGPAPCPPE